MNTLEGRLAAEWLRHRTPRWLPAVVLVAGWGAAFAMAVVGNGPACTPNDPNVCGPDPAFGWALGLFFSVLVLAFVAPVMACLAGIAFSVLGLLYDSDRAARAAFPGFAVFCATLAVVLVSRRRAQRRIFATRGVNRPMVSHYKPPLVDRPVGAFGVVLLLGLVAGLAVYQQRTTAEAAHMRVAQRQEAIVTLVDQSTEEIDVRLTDGAVHRLEVADTGPYPRSSSTPVLVDPTDPSWMRLVAEPADFTMWLAGSSLCGVLLSLLLVWQVVGARARWRLLSSSTGGVDVRVSLAGPRRVNIHPLGQGWVRPVASFVAAANPGEVALVCTPATTWSDDPWRHLEAPELRTATVVGNFADGGWIAIVGQDGVLLPRTTLRVARGDSEGGKRGRTSPAVETAVRTVYQSDPGAKVPQLPLSVAATQWTLRALRGWLVAAVSLVVSAVVAAMSGSVKVPWQILPVGGYFFIFGAALIRARIVLSHAGFESHGVWRTYIVPWSQVTEVARSGNRLLVAVPDGVIALPEVSGSQLSERVDEVGRAMTALRDRAQAVGASSGVVRVTFGPAWPSLGVYVVVVGLAFALGHNLL